MSTYFTTRAAASLGALAVILVQGPAHAGFLDGVREAIRGAGEAGRVYEQHREGERRQEVHEASMEERQQAIELQAERERTANAIALQEAEQRREMWNAMTPEQRRAYMEEQERLAAQEQEAAMLFTGMIAAAVIEGMTRPSCVVGRNQWGDYVEVC
ncbi:hypothetical protein IQ241_03545 [Romeria aff. gracilis LEGE 07310]|uniref:Uncharacterized protein n=1 Tax=Vasconcelosia minhoensis LEGE 07310 TaxID=915328 RepID=A0A8J7A5I7_9CYAN|nr:hypothetical protein [Romeria gracilis]MBE9076375.1 hypothetical protein [Romeria aff. gracilis LEGE 07310]